MPQGFRVLIVTYTRPNALNGVRVYSQVLQTHLPDMGISVELATPLSSSKPLRCLYEFLRRHGRIENAAGAPASRQPKSLFRRLLSRSGLFHGAARSLFIEVFCWILVRSALKRVRVRPDLIHAQDPGSAAAAVRVFKGRIPVLATFHFSDNPTDEALLAYGLVGARASAMRRWYAWTFKHTRDWTAVSRYSAEQLQPHVPADARIRVVHNGVDFDAAAKAMPDDDLRRRYAGKILVLNVGTLEPRKNQRQILDLAERLRDTQAVFLLVGDGPDRPALEDEIQCRHLEGRVILLGQRTDVPRIMKTADIYLHTALKEAFGLVVAEAVAAGLPVLTSASGGPSEIVGVEAESCFPVGSDADYIVQRIRKLILDPAYREDLARRQREHALQLCSLETMLDSLHGIYREIAQHDRGSERGDSSERNG